MKSPKDMGVIQIELTNACIHQCSNCTRFCGHHKTPFFMDSDTFKKAVLSLKDFPGMVGIMGGEPTLHPDFPELMEFYRENIPETTNHKLLQPVKNIGTFRNENLNHLSARRGIWTSLGKGYYRNFELIQDTFPYQCINDHQNPGLHQSLLISRKELGIDDEEWVKLRDECWIQNLWSASITPKGAFFCEIAAALDMLFDGPGGWPIEPGWWKRTPDEFGDQLQWCELCAACLAVPRIEAKLKTDIISPVLMEKLEKLNSSKIKKKQFLPFDPESYNAEDYIRNTKNSQWYLPNQDSIERISDTNSSIKPKSLSVFDSSSNKQDTGADKVLTDDEFKNMEFNEWCMLIRKDIPEIKGFAEEFKSWVFNPGCVYFSLDEGVKFKRKMLEDIDSLIKNCRVIIFNRNASFLTENKTLDTKMTFLKNCSREKFVCLNKFPKIAPPLTLRTIVIRLAYKILSKWRSLTSV